MSPRFAVRRGQNLARSIKNRKKTKKSLRDKTNDDVMGHDIRLTHAYMMTPGAPHSGNLPTNFNLMSAFSPKSATNPRAGIPELTHLQFVVLESLGNGELKGFQIREKLESMGCSKSKPAFYQLMSRMEESGYIDGRYEQKVVESQIIKERVYNSTLSGGRALKDVLSFYDEHLRISSSLVS